MNMKSRGVINKITPLIFMFCFGFRVLALVTLALSHCHGLWGHLIEQSHPCIVSNTVLFPTI